MESQGSGPPLPVRPSGTLSSHALGPATVCSSLGELVFPFGISCSPEWWECPSKAFLHLLLPGGLELPPAWDQFFSLAV